MAVPQPAVGDVMDRIPTPRRRASTFGDKILSPWVDTADYGEWEQTLVAILGEMVDDGKIPDDACKRKSG